MTVGFQNYGYTNYPQTNVLNQAQTKVANTSIQDSYAPTKAKTNKGAVAVGLTAAAGVALTAFAASKGKKITGQDKLLANLKAGFSQIKDDVVKYAKTAWNKIKNSGVATSTETIKPNTVETGLSTFVDATTTGATQVSGQNQVIKNITNAAKKAKEVVTNAVNNGINKVKDIYNKFKSNKAVTYFTEEGLQITRYPDTSYRGIKVK